MATTGTGNGLKRRSTSGHGCGRWSGIFEERTHLHRAISGSAPLATVGERHLHGRSFCSCCRPPSLCSFWVRDRPEDAGFKPYKEPEEDSVSTRAEALTDHEVSGLKAWVILLKNWGFMAMCFGAFTTYIGRFGLLTWTPLFWAETAGIKLKDVPIMTFALPIGMIMGPFVAGVISDKFFKASRYPMIAIYIGCAIICLILMASIPIQTMGLFWAMTLLFFSGFFILGVIGSQWTLAMDFGARKLAGTAVGFYNGFNYLGAGIQGLLIGGILHWSGGNWPMVFGTVAAVLALGALVTMLGARARTHA
jgi:sugar phosphate permease